MGFIARNYHHPILIITGVVVTGDKFIPCVTKTISIGGKNNTGDSISLVKLTSVNSQ
jgi:hypothetical protein